MSEIVVLYDYVTAWEKMQLILFLVLGILYYLAISECLVLILSEGLLNFAFIMLLYELRFNENHVFESGIPVDTKCQTSRIKL